MSSERIHNPSRRFQELFDEAEVLLNSGEAHVVLSNLKDHHYDYSGQPYLVDKLFEVGLGNEVADNFEWINFDFVDQNKFAQMLLGIKRGDAVRANIDRFTKLTTDITRILTENE